MLCQKKKESSFLNITSTGTRKPRILNLQCTYLQITHILETWHTPTKTSASSGSQPFRLLSSCTTEQHRVSKGLYTQIYLITRPM